MTQESTLATSHIGECFVLLANRLDKQGHRQAAMDLLYDRIDELMRAGQFEALDGILQRVPVEAVSLDVLLGLLAATLPALSRLPARAEFFLKTEHVLKGRAEWDEGLLKGL